MTEIPAVEFVEGVERVTVVFVIEWTCRWKRAKSDWREAWIQVILISQVRMNRR